MGGILFICVVVAWTLFSAKKKNDLLKKEAAKKQGEVTRSAQKPGSETNLSLASLKKKLEESMGIPGKLGQPVAGESKEMPIEARRRSQQQAADRSRIHQSLHKKEGRADASVDNTAKHTGEIRFRDGELMEEVYEIMACGYPARCSGQRDFLAEGAALLDRYTLG